MPTLRCLLFISFLFLTLLLQSQNIEGNVIAADTNEPLPFANLTLLTKNIGATTNEKGDYWIDVKGNLSDSLLVSYIGYSSKRISLKEFEEGTTYKVNFELTPNTEAIDEVVLQVKKQKYTRSKKIGIKKQLFKYGKSVPFGYEHCVLIKNSVFKEGKVKKVSVFFKKKESGLYEVLPTYFRLKFYEYDYKRKKPGNLLSYNQIIIQPENKTQKITLDLEEYYIKYPVHGLCVGIETFNPGKNRDSKIMYLTSPNIRLTYDDEALTWESYKGKEWGKNTTKLRSQVFGKVKYSYANPIIHLEVQYKK